MKIVDLRAVYPKYNHPAKTWRTHFWQIVVRVETDCGTVGWGYGGGGVAAVEVVNRHLREVVVGASLNSLQDIEILWDQLYKASLPYGRGGIAVMAISGIDLALWDALARAEGIRVCELIGRTIRPKIRAYATSQNPEYVRDAGFSAHKSTQLMDGNRDQVLDRLLLWASDTRDLLGPQTLLMIDAYMSWDPDFVINVASGVKEYDIYWLEDVLSPDDLVGLSSLRSRINTVKLAGGEHDFTSHYFSNIAQANALDIWQPDVTWCGGMTELLRITKIADSFRVPVCPHRGGEVWGLHFLAAGCGIDLAECHMGNFAVKQHRLWIGEPQPIDGYLELSDEVGFGVRPNEAFL